MSTKEEWIGDLGRRWAQRADEQDALLAPWQAPGMEAVGEVAGRATLDLGCGPGASSLELARRGARVTGVDVSPDLIEVARARAAAAGLEGEAAFALADAAADDLGGPFDLLFSRFGAMFFDDAPAAWANIRAAMAPGARMTVLAWRSVKENDWAGLPLRLCADLVPEIPRPERGAPGPFGWADPGFFAEVLQAAGWRGISWRAVDRMMPVAAGDDPDPVERAIEAAFAAGPLARFLAQLPEAAQEEARARLRAALPEHVSDGAVRLPGGAWLVSARA